MIKNEGEPRLGVKDYLWAVVHPAKFIEVKRRQILVSLEQELPPSNSTIEEFPLLSPRQAASLIDKEGKREREVLIMEEERFRRVVDLFDRVVFGSSASALEELSGAATGGINYAQKYIKIIDGLNLKLGDLNRREEIKGRLFGHCPNCGALGIEEKNAEYGEYWTYFACSGGDYGLYTWKGRTQKVPAYWLTTKDPSQKAIEDMGYTWNQLHFSSQYRKEHNIV